MKTLLVGFEGLRPFPSAKISKFVNLYWDRFLMKWLALSTKNFLAEFLDCFLTLRLTFLLFDGVLSSTFMVLVEEMAHL